LKYKTNTEIFTEAKRYIPGGVNSPVRSFNSVGGTPFFTKRSLGCYLYDIEDNKYIDYVSSWGANIVGHANPYVVELVTQALHNGFSFGTPTELEVELARQINYLMPNIEKLRLVSSGTEAAMSAIRLARGYTGRKYVIKFVGCYHGHSDSLLVKAGSGVATFSASSMGVLDSSVAETIVLEYNDVESLTTAFTHYADKIACVIIEPFVGNMNLIRPSAEFLAALVELCKTQNSILIFDEVMTGFRVGLGGAQQVLGIKPDLTILGKVIGGGMPLAAFGGRTDIMDYLSPLGDVYQAGTLSGNPIAVTSGLATLELVQVPNFYENLTAVTRRLIDGLVKVANQHGVTLCGDNVGGMFGLYFNQNIPRNFTEAALANNEAFKQFFHAMLKRGVFFAPSMYEAGFLCSAHTNAIIDQTIDIANDVFVEYNINK
jgi:glutamate-1-semialdehyde 2,1-aminomutase